MTFSPSDSAREAGHYNEHFNMMWFEFPTKTLLWYNYCETNSILFTVKLDLSRHLLEGLSFSVLPREDFSHVVVGKCGVRRMLARGMGSECKLVILHRALLLTLTLCP